MLAQSYFSCQEDNRIVNFKRNCVVNFKRTVLLFQDRGTHKRKRELNRVYTL